MSLDECIRVNLLSAKLKWKENKTCIYVKVQIETLCTKFLADISKITDHVIVLSYNLLTRQLREGPKLLLAKVPKQKFLTGLVYLR